MATSKKSSGKKSAGKKGGGTKGGGAKKSYKPPIIVLYGPAIREAATRGDQAEMKRVAAQARKHISDVQAALQRLESKLGGGGK
ncbi:MAG TPA: DUF1843 domain-containing protein [Pyrinomonadaceae bacterium]|nr:DUF1843 domain-containing protein [Pyrinomonadaceae bacterium]